MRAAIRQRSSFPWRENASTGHVNSTLPKLIPNSTRIRSRWGWISRPNWSANGRPRPTASTRSRIRHAKLQNRRCARQGRPQVAPWPLVAGRTGAGLSTDHSVAVLPGTWLRHRQRHANAALGACRRHGGDTAPCDRQHCDARPLQCGLAGHRRQSHVHRSLRRTPPPPGAGGRRQRAWSGSSWAAERSSILLRGQLVRPKRTLESGYVFRYPELRPALADLVAC